MNKIAIIIPCYNEGPAIAQVIADFRAVLSESTIYVYDNNSNDDTVFQAQQAGALVHYEYRQGKGHVIRRAFADIEADVYILVDGDGTYDAQAAQEMVHCLLTQQLDMVVAVRQAHQAHFSYRRGHRWGNQFLTRTIGLLFEQQFQDVLSGYRVLSRRFVKSFPVLATGFEIEVMLTVHALQLRMPTEEINVAYFPRIQGTESKLSTVKDGLTIFFTIIVLFKDIYPFIFFGFLTALFALTSIGLAIPIIVEFLSRGLVPRLPTALLATGLMIFAGIFLICGLILDSVSKARLEQKYLAYLRPK